MSIASDIVGASPAKVLGGISAEELEALYRSERDRMVRMALLLVGSAADAEELVQESFVRVARARRPIDNPPPISGRPWSTSAAATFAVFECRGASLRLPHA